MVRRLDSGLGRFPVAVAAVLLLALAGSLQAEESEGPATDAAHRTGNDASLNSAGGTGDGCVESETAMCLQDGRYEVTIVWETLSGERGPAKVARPRTRNSGLFYFFNYDNWEVLLKVLDGCAYNGHHWVYAASATDLGLHIVVRDTVTGLAKEYTKEPGTPAPATTDSGAFPESC